MLPSARLRDGRSRSGAGVLGGTDRLDTAAWFPPRIRFSRLTQHIPVQLLVQRLDAETPVLRDPPKPRHRTTSRQDCANWVLLSVI